MAFLHPDAELIHDGTRVDLRVVELEKHSGGTQRREIAEVADAVTVLPLLDDGRVVMIRNRRFAVNDTLLELPAGTLDAGEDPDACAVRELEEETGYRASKLRKVTGFYTSPGFCTEFMHGYVATGLTPTRQNLDETEEIEVEPMPLDDVLTMARKGDPALKDGKSLLLLTWYAAFSKR